jgi:ribosomal protein S18 acetylase RimI-like enzyme
MTFSGWKKGSAVPDTFNVTPMDGMHIPAVLALTSNLQEYFPDEAMPMIEFSLKEHKAIIGSLNNDIVAFLVYEFHRNKETVEILWMGVKKDYHGLGLGTSMLEELERIIEQKGISKIVTSTLSYTVDYKPFEKVRSFFYRRGFKEIGIQDDYYEEGVDRLILFKKL